VNASDDEDDVSAAGGCMQVGGELRDRGGRVHSTQYTLHPLPGLLQLHRHSARQRRQLRQGLAPFLSTGYVCR